MAQPRPRARPAGARGPLPRKDDGVSRIIYTDISRDGTAAGVNISDTLKIARAVAIPIIASGGVASLDDLQKLLPLQQEGIEGVIIGKALYAGAFSLAKALTISTAAG